MELVAPAGNLEKLEAAWSYGADAAYLGLAGLSLRSRADNFSPVDASAVRSLKGKKKLYCALNIIFRKDDLRRLAEAEKEIASLPIDAFIVSDPAVIPFLRSSFPGAELHLSTQAACSSAESARFWADQGFSRIIPSRELGLGELEEMKRALPGVELEVFVHGAMCVAYSGRCLLSAALAGRSANSGACTQSCRWEYRLLEEAKRPGEPIGLLESEGYSMILSSRDLCLIDHLASLRDAGVDALKIEGRMKSSYYVGAVAAAYRAALDDLAAGGPGSAGAFREELFRVSHRSYGTGFLFPENREALLPATEGYRAESLFLGIFRRQEGDSGFLLEVRNSFEVGEILSCIGPGRPSFPLEILSLSDPETGEALDRAINQKPCILACRNLDGSPPPERGFFLLRASVLCEKA